MIHPLRSASTPLFLLQPVNYGRIQRGDRGLDPPLPVKSQKLEFLSNTVPDPLKNHKATKPELNIGPPSARQRSAI